MRFLRLYMREIIAALLTLTVILLGAVIISANFDIRVKEFNSFLDDQNLTDASVSYANLIAKYVRHKNLFEGTADQSDVAIKELLYHRYAVTRPRVRAAYTSFERPAAGVINILRWVLRKPPMAVYENALDRFPLHEAYQYERGKQYAKAAVLYEAIASSGRLPARMGQSVLLHRGFCRAMLEEYDDARADYAAVIARYPGTEAAFVASLLIKYMDEFNREKEAVLRGGASLLAGEKVAILMGSKKALEILSSVKAHTPVEAAKIEFYKGFCYEELGDEARSAENYERSANADARSGYARTANRKLYAMGVRATNETLIARTLVRGKKQGDTTLAAAHALCSAPERADLSRMTVLMMSNTVAQRPTPKSPAAGATAKAISVEKVNREISVLKGTRVRVVTIDDEEFTGVLMTSESAQIFHISTIVGAVSIDKRRVKVMEADK